MTEPLLISSKFELTFEVDGPGFPRPFYPADTPVLLKPKRVTATVILEGGAPCVQSLRVEGTRQKKDGSHSLTAMEDVWFISSRWNDKWPPAYIMAVGEEARRLVWDMLKGTGEVTV